MTTHGQALLDGMGTEIEVERGETFARGSTRPWRTNYQCVGPDGVHYQNSCKATLAHLLRRRYGKVNLVIVDGPTWRRTP